MRGRWRFTSVHSEVVANSLGHLALSSPRRLRADDRNAHSTEVPQKYKKKSGILFVALATLAFRPRFRRKRPLPTGHGCGNPRLTGISDSKVPNDLKLCGRMSRRSVIESSAACRGRSSSDHKGEPVTEPGEWCGQLEVSDRRAYRGIVSSLQRRCGLCWRPWWLVTRGQRVRRKENLGL